jgi:hypothetical protein
VRFHETLQELLSQQRPLLTALEEITTNETVSRLSDQSLGGGNGEIVASGLATMLWEVGSLLGLATLVYLLAPAGERVEEPARRAG